MLCALIIYTMLHHSWKQLNASMENQATPPSFSSTCMVEQSQLHEESLMYENSCPHPNPKSFLDIVVDMFN